MRFLERLRQVNAPGPPEESVALRMAVLLAVMVAGLAVLSPAGAGPGLTVAVVAGIPFAFWLSWWARHRDRFWLKVALAVGAIVVLARFLGTARTVAPATFADLQVPLAELFLWVQLLHALDVPARRDLMFSLVSSLVLMAVAGVLSVSMTYVPYLLAWSVAATASLVLAYRSELGEVPALPAVAAVAWSRPPSAAGFVLRPVLGVVTLVAILGTVAFLVLPPAGGARALTFPSRLARLVPLPSVAGALFNPTMGSESPDAAERSRARGGRASFGYFGFSDRLDTGIRGRPDSTLVMRVRASRPDYWRGQTFATFDGRTWRVSGDRPRAVGGPLPMSLPAPVGEEGREEGTEFVQTFYVERPGPNLLFAAPTASELYFPDSRVFALPDGTLRSGVALDAGAAYTVVSRRLPVSGALLRAADADRRQPPAALATTYGSPLPTTERVRRLAAEVTAGAPTTYDKVRALERWMAANTRYTLDIPPLPPGADAADQFLFVDREGFCEQIGTSLVVMLRSLGIPARLVAGYVSGERNPFTGLYEVRARDAHAWAEVYFPGIGWQGFDPTAHVPLAADASVERAGAGLLSYLANHLPRFPGPVLVAMVAAATAAGGAVVSRGVILWVARARRRPPASWPQLWTRRLAKAGARHGRPLGPADTLAEYAVALQSSPLAHPRLDEAAAIVTRAAFGEAPMSDEERTVAERVLEESVAAGRAEAGRTLTVMDQDPQATSAAGVGRSGPVPRP